MVMVVVMMMVVAMMPVMMTMVMVAMMMVMMRHLHRVIGLGGVVGERRSGDHKS
jgi:hypothetical protein